MLSILIPSRSEPYLQKTIEDIKEHAETNPEILWEEDTNMGQRALTNKLARMAKGEYLMKIDAHCSFSQGFDRIMLEDMNENDLLAIDLRDLDVDTWQMKPTPLTSQVVFDTNFDLKSAPERPGLIVET